MVFVISRQASSQDPDHQPAGPYLRPPQNTLFLHSVQAVGLKPVTGDGRMENGLGARRVAPDGVVCRPFLSMKSKVGLRAP